ncbi:hypothetical protein M231_05916 [Tremella mesenterica]|uniref:Zn(2)-C6 fungal-type domain-containing protein n=1 Tax=Tremella mesenterica TaxID=5217 RepID=A0A4Q1BGY2_TREME|nr:hypothetical protein M231_05916 [Tremella mesenterica]
MKYPNALGDIPNAAQESNRTNSIPRYNYLDSPSSSNHPHSTSIEQGRIQTSPLYDPHSNFLGPLPDACDEKISKSPVLESQDGQTGEHAHGEVTESALNQLFKDLDQSHEAQIQQDQLLDPTLADHDHQLDDYQHDHNHSSTNSQEGQSYKRKATSRANMLARGGACEFCKKRKLKCTAELPSCSACIRAGKECVYSQKKQRSRVRQLEDRLVELEKRLESTGSGSGVSTVTSDQNSTLVNAVPYLTSRRSSEALIMSQAHHVSLTERDELFSLPTPEGSFTLAGLDMTGGTGMEHIEEPDLMTLADAAAANAPVMRRMSSDDWPWEGMTADAIGHALVRAVEGGKGIGEKILTHLIQIYVTAPPSAMLLLLDACPPQTLLHRLSPSSTDPPHPSLLLALLPFLLSASTSPALSADDHVDVISTHLVQSSRMHSLSALSMADGRLLDLVAADTIRGWGLFCRARFLDGISDLIGLAVRSWSAGLGKLGGTGARFVGGDDEWKVLVERNARIKTFRRKTAVHPPPNSATDLAARIKLL